MVTKASTLGTLGITLFDMTLYGGNGVNRPAVGVSWNEAARFINWLNTSTGSTPAYKFAIQPGEPGYNSFQDILLWDPGDPGYNPNNLYRNSLARYFLPSVDEWYKAAYYDPTSGVYYDYPTGSNLPPTPVASGTGVGTAVYNGQFGPAATMLAGGLSPYGTMGQGGNIWEWEETDFDLVNDSSSSFREFRGGYWGGISPANLHASNRLNATVPSSWGHSIGFRVASVIPEPSTLLLVAMATFGWLRLRRSRQS
jgi:formylglycine-generating enzyme required for sulfatase activity